MNDAEEGGETAFLHADNQTYDPQVSIAYSELWTQGQATGKFNAFSRLFPYLAMCLTTYCSLSYQRCRKTPPDLQFCTAKATTMGKRK